MVARSKYFWLSHVSRVALVLALFSLSEILLQELQAPDTHAASQVQTFTLKDLSTMSAAHAKDNSPQETAQERKLQAEQERREQREARRERQQQIRQERLDQKQQLREERRQARLEQRQQQREQRQQRREELRQQREQQRAERKAQQQQARKERQEQRRQAREERRQQRQQKDRDDDRQHNPVQSPEERHVKRQPEPEKPNGEPKQESPKIGRVDGNGASDAARPSRTRKPQPQAKPRRKTSSPARKSASRQQGKGSKRSVEPSKLDAAEPPGTLKGLFASIGDQSAPAPTNQSTPLQSPTPDSGTVSGTGSLLQPVAPSPAAKKAPVRRAKARPAKRKKKPATRVSKAKKKPTIARNRGGQVAPEDLLLDFPDIPPRELLATNVGPASLKSAMALGFKVSSSQSYSRLGMSVTKLEVPRGMNLQAAQNILRHQLQRGSIGVNHFYRLYRTATGQDEEAHLSSDPANVCREGGCYGQTAIGWRRELGRCAEGIKIGVIDTGIDIRHPVFSGSQIEFADAMAYDKTPSSDEHGTGILAVLAGDPKSDVGGLIPGASFVISDIFFEDSEGFPVTDTMSLLKALEWMGKQGVAVVNLSLAGPSDPLVKQAIARLTKRGMIFIAAAGNGGPSAEPKYPAAYKDVIAVTAVAKSLRAFRHANHGDYIDIAAPGVRIWTAQPDSSYGFKSGTSFAVPFVTAAVAAIYRSLPEKTRSGVLDRLSVLDLGEPGKDNVYGNGLMLAPVDCSPPSVAWSTTVQPEKFKDDWNSKLVVSR